MFEQVGITVRAYDLDGEDLGQIYVPAPSLSEACPRSSTARITSSWGFTA